MESTLKGIGISLGLVAVGVAPAIDEVRLAYPWAQSVVCAAISYLPHFDTVAEPHPLSASGRCRGLVARVARSADYHVVLREKLRRLAEVFEAEYPDARTEICVDTNPIPERKLAALSGIAWRGKNSNVFVEGCGSWVALGEIVTDAPIASCGNSASLNTLDCDRPAFPQDSELSTNLCGDCTRCMDACPTKAISAPYEIDRGRCLSAITQSSGSIDPGLRPLMGNRIYGCDVCQEVCPQNADVRPTTPEFAADVFPGAHPELIPLISMTAHEFNSTVRDGSIGWIRRTRIRRNAAIAAGNLRSAEALPALRETLSDENAILREAAEWAIKEIDAGASKK